MRRFPAGSSQPRNSRRVLTAWKVEMPPDEASRSRVTIPTACSRTPRRGRGRMQTPCRRTAPIQADAWVDGGTNIEKRRPITAVLVRSSAYSRRLHARVNGSGKTYTLRESVEASARRRSRIARRSRHRPTIPAVAFAASRSGTASNPCSSKRTLIACRRMERG